MWRINLAQTTRNKNNERGAIAPLTAILMVALLGMVSLAIDTAMMYSEHAQLQNGADASALAIAGSCGVDLHALTCQKDLANANALAGSNALDGLTEVVKANVAGDGTVYVEVQASEGADKKGFTPVFASLLGIKTVDIRASAEAKLVGYSAANVLPVAFSQCEAEQGWTRPLQFLPLHGSTFSRVCKSKSSGLEIPGGFGWLVDPVTDGGCSLSINLATRSYGSDTGSNVPSDCWDKFNQFESALGAGKSVEVLIPIYDSISGNGKNATFQVEAFAMISLRGWKFGVNGREYMPPDAQQLSTSMNLRPTDTGFFGKYIRKVSWAEAAVLGGPATYGALGVRLSK